MTEQSGKVKTGQSVWLKPAKPVRDVPALSKERILDAALEILNKEGLAGLTMRKLARNLNAGAASLYWYVETRDEVLELALDAVLGDIGYPPESEDWQATLIAYMHEWRRVLLRHHWAPALIGFRPFIGPNALERSEYLRRTLMHSGLDTVEVIQAGYALSNFMIGSVVTQIAWQSGGGDNTHPQIKEFMQAQAQKYPLLASQMAYDLGDWDASYIKGLNWIIRALVKA
ncbi:TetR/AcrR family transcriptional regulator C-terminal domain-containing protein [Paenochrobactrum sp. BZR 588]|uniref:TetR/AcrR family transcriptional regulator C-terminal domain-containing protein n=1 Tax=Paenochrobactrum TaxID=999488 RepID=UPI0035BC5648